MVSRGVQSMSADEKRWQAEDDMRTLIRAKEIKADKARLKRALKMADEQLKELKGLSEE